MAQNGTISQKSLTSNKTHITPKKKKKSKSKSKYKLRKSERQKVNHKFSPNITLNFYLTLGPLPPPHLLPHTLCLSFATVHCHLTQSTVPLSCPSLSSFLCLPLCLCVSTSNLHPSLFAFVSLVCHHFWSLVHHDFWSLVHSSMCLTIQTLDFFSLSSLISSTKQSPLQGFSSHITHLLHPSMYCYLLVVTGFVYCWLLLI